MASTNGSSTSATTKQTVKSQISANLSQYFGSTLNRETDMANIFMALIQLESSFNVNAQGRVISTSISSGARDYWNSTPIQNLLTTGTPAQKSLAAQGLQAWGLAQSMGWNSIQGASKQNGKCEIEIARPDLAGMLVFPPGTDLSEKFNGVATISNQILAGLVILEHKYKYVTGSGTSFKYGNASTTFNTKLAAAVGAYLGTGSADVVTGITPQQYVANIMYGEKYKLANGNYSSGVSTNSPTNTPIITTASGNNQVPPGC